MFANVIVWRLEIICSSYLVLFGRPASGGALGIGVSTFGVTISLGHPLLGRPPVGPKVDIPLRCNLVILFHGSMLDILL